MIETLDIVGEYVRSTPGAWAFFLPLAMGFIDPRMGFLILAAWFAYAWTIT